MELEVVIPYNADNANKPPLEGCASDFNVRMARAS